MTKMEATPETPAVPATAKDAAPLRDARGTRQAPAPGSSEAGTPAQPAAQQRAMASSLAKKEAASADSDSGPSARPWEQDPRAWLTHVAQLRTSGRIEDAKASC
jgi:hypothetical protein